MIMKSFLKKDVKILETKLQTLQNNNTKHG